MHNLKKPTIAAINNKVVNNKERRAECFNVEAGALIDDDEIAGIPDQLLPVLLLENSPIATHQYINH